MEAVQKKKFRLLAADLDGTLLDDSYSVRPELRTYIDRAREKGVELVVATGRLYPSALPFVTDLEVRLPVIASNGAIVKDPQNDQVVQRTALDRELAREALLLTEGYPVQRFADIAGTFYTDAPEENTDKYSKALRVKFIHCDTIGDMLTEDPTMLVIRGTDDIISKLTGVLREHFGNRVYLANSKPFFIDINQSGVSKGAALADLCKRLGFDLAEVIAIGDGWNDLEMFEVAGIGAAVANAPEALKDKADYVCEEENYHGVIEVIKRFIL